MVRQHTPLSPSTALSPFHLLARIIEIKVQQHRVQPPLRLRRTRRLSTIPHDRAPQQFHGPDRAAADLDLDVVAVPDGGQGAQAVLEAGRVGQHVQVVQDLRDAVVRERGQVRYVGEEAVGGAAEAGPEVGGEDLGAFV